MSKYSNDKPKTGLTVEVRNGDFAGALRKFKKVGIIPLSIFGKTSTKGESYHFGAQFKSNNSIKENSSDLLGRIANLKNSYIIDSSVLPVVNTGPITYSVMANSYRIADEFLQKLK